MRRTYTRAWLKKNFKKAEVVKAFKHFESEGSITRPLHGNPISELSLEDFVDEYVKPNYVADFATYILKQRSDLKKKYDSLRVDQKAEAQVIKGYAKADILKALHDLSISIPNKQSLQLHALASEIAMTDDSSKVIKYLKANANLKGRKSPGPDDDSSSSSSEEESEEEKKEKPKKRKNKAKKSKSKRSKKEESSEEESTSESEDSSSEEESSEEEIKKKKKTDKKRKDTKKAKGKKNEKKRKESSSEDESSDSSDESSSDSEQEKKKKNKKRAKPKYKKH